MSKYRKAEKELLTAKKEIKRLKNALMSKNPGVPLSQMDCLIKEAIRDAVKKALEAKPTKVIVNKIKYQFYAMDNVVWGEHDAIEHILGDYSWWKTQ